VLINDLSTTVLNGQCKHTDKLQAWNQNLTLDGRIVVVEKTIGGSLLTPLAEASGLCDFAESEFFRFRDVSSPPDKETSHHLRSYNRIWRPYSGSAL